MKKRVRTFRLTPETLEKLNAQARKRGLSQTQVIEELIKLAP
jgi:predicted DNA-binding protein